MPVATAVIGLIGTIIGTAVSLYGVYKQEEENKKTRTTSERWRREDISREESQFGETLGLREEQLGFEREQAAKKWEWEEDERDWNRKSEFVNRISSIPAVGMQLEQNIQQRWPARSGSVGGVI